MKRTCLASETCPVARSLDAVGDWWSLLIVRDALFGRRRFGEFQAHLGVAKNILAARLKKLVADGILEAVPAADGGARREYALTEKGRGLYLVIVALRQWSEGCPAAGGGGVALVDRLHGRPVRPLVLQAADGRTLGPGDIAFVPASLPPPPSREGEKTGTSSAKRRRKP